MWFVPDGLDELFKFILCPEQHFVGILFAHAPGFVAGILGEIIILHRIIEYGSQLIVDGFEIGLGKSLALLIPIGGQLVLPLANVCG